MVNFVRLAHYMRLPIRLNTLNLLLVGLMLAAPILGKLARKELSSQKEQEKITEMVMLSKPAIQKKAEEPLQQAHRPMNPSYLQWLQNQKRKQKLEELPKPIPKAPSSPRADARPFQETPRPAGNFMDRMKELAREGDWEHAEQEFLSLLEEKEVAPLEALEKVQEFRTKFEKLSVHLSSEDKISM